MSMENFITPALSRIDAYKLGHKKMYPEGTELVYNNFTPRSEKLSSIPPHLRKHEVVVIGVQRFVKLLKTVWGTTFFSKNCDEVVSEWEELIQPLAGSIKYDASHIRALHNLGYLPLEIKAIQEGLSVPFGIPAITIKNTHPEFAWLPGFLEDFVSAELWKPMTTATIAKAYRELMEKYADITGGDKNFINWQGHDFSLRGMSGIEDGAIAGIGHLLFFAGTDNTPAVRAIKQVYSKGWAYGSVPASEHSVMCAGGKDTEKETFERMLDLYPEGIVSIVSDTWDYWDVLTVTIPSLKDKIMARKEDVYGNCKTALRPDSGDPVKIICGEEYIVADDLDEAEVTAKELFRELYYDLVANECGDDLGEYIAKVGEKYYEVTVFPYWNRHDKTYYYIDGWGKTKFSEVELTPEQKGSVEVLWEIFGGTVNEKGYRTLDKHIGLVYGDSITLERCEAILEGLKNKGFASDNIVFGIGSFTYQLLTRDSNGFAVKATYTECNGEAQDIFKEPKTDSGTKKSAKGLLSVVQEEGKIVLKQQCTKEEEQQGMLKTVFINGEVMLNEDFITVRERAGYMNM